MKKNPSLKIFQPAVAAALAIVIAWGFSVRPAQAAGYVVTLDQVGPNVVATGTGAIDFTGLTLAGTIHDSSLLVPDNGTILTGPTTTPAGDAYSGFSGPTSFGTGSQTPASSGSGDIVGIFGQTGFLIVPQGYVSGDALSDSSTYNSATFSSLGVTAGTYEWTWGNGPDQNFTVEALPEPATWLAAALVAIGLVLNFFIRRRAA